MSVANDGRAPLGIRAGRTLLGFAFAVGASVAGAQPDRPNIVVLLADDLGYGSVSWYGSDIPTPHIDSVARNGVGFVAGYVTAPVCNPSRPALMTGRYQQRWGKELNSQTIPPCGRGPQVAADERDNACRRPQGRGLRDRRGRQMAARNGRRVPPIGPRLRFLLRDAIRIAFRRPGLAERAHRAGSRGPGGAGWHRPHPGTLSGAGARGDGRIPDGPARAREGVEFITRHKDEPFFLYLAFHAPHGPIQTIDKYYQRFPAIENETARIYAAMISALDDWVGAVLAELRRHGLEENTLVIFASDNGAARQSDVDGKRNSPLIGHKRNLYEGWNPRSLRAAMEADASRQGRDSRSPSARSTFSPPRSPPPGPRPLPGSAELDGVNLLPFVEDALSALAAPTSTWSGVPAPTRQFAAGAWKLLLTQSGLGEAVQRARLIPGESRGSRIRAAPSGRGPARSARALGAGQGGPTRGCPQREDEIQRRRD